MQRKTESRPWATNLFVVAFLLGIGYVIWLSTSSPPSEATPVPSAPQST